MTISTILKTKGSKVVSVRDSDTVDSAVKALVREKIGAVLVTDAEGKVCGILSERDVVVELSKSGAKLLTKPVSELMTRDLVRCGPGDSVLKAMAMMTDRRIRHLPIFDGDELLGIVSVGDLVKRRMEEIQAEANALREYIAL